MVSYGCTGIFFMHLAGVKIEKTLKIIGMNLLIFLPAGLIMSLSIILNFSGSSKIILATILLFIYGGYVIKTDSTVRDLFQKLQNIKERLKYISDIEGIFIKYFL